jgi:hypothetical protein
MTSDAFTTRLAALPRVAFMAGGVLVGALGMRGLDAYVHRVEAARAAQAGPSPLDHLASLVALTQILRSQRTVLQGTVTTGVPFLADQAQRSRPTAPEVQL